MHQTHFHLTGSQSVAHKKQRKYYVHDITVTKMCQLNTIASVCNQTEYRKQFHNHACFCNLC